MPQAESKGHLFRPARIGALELPSNLFLAPVAGYTDAAFRSVCAEMGAAFAYTEMVSAEALARGSAKTERLMARAKGEARYAVQIFGSSPSTMGRAARIVLDKTDADCIDINAGCPVPKIVKTGAGAALAKDPKALFAAVSAVASAARERAADRGGSLAPVTVKIRAGWDESSLTWKEAALAALAAGAAAVTLHPRTRAQGYEGEARWELVARLKEEAAAQFPGAAIFGSGDLFSAEDARAMLAQTGCDGVMFARGAIGNPFIFRQAEALLQGREAPPVSDAERMGAAWKEFLLLEEAAGEKTACLEMRKRLCAYTKGLPGGAALRKRIASASAEADYRKIFAAWIPELRP